MSDEIRVIRLTMKGRTVAAIAMSVMLLAGVSAENASLALHTRTRQRPTSIVPSAVTKGTMASITGTAKLVFHLRQTITLTLLLFPTLLAYWHPNYLSFQLAVLQLGS
ncbi:MAG: hypothetical protein QXN83_01195 [Nitrososphaerales archaeon]